MNSLDTLIPAIQQSWGADTTYDPSEWTKEHASRGQCVVTSLVVQHFLGGELQKVTTVFNGQPESHYFNQLPDGTVLDLTRGQYPADQPLSSAPVSLHGYATVRDKMMHESETVRRYNLLLERVNKKLGA